MDIRNSKAPPMPYLDVTRYNQGFGWFGPLEQAAEGKLCKYEAAEKAYSKCRDAYSWLHMELQYSNRRAEGLLVQVDTWFTVSLVLLAGLGASLVYIWSHS